ncbi:hypothetical protein ElP_63930 [Tautonia plasticadhaerens]|uniref:Uncharacterized protein n=1 Tax=Tautonia plasticadhaerens TaxID=2527974 RepID=A0A518HC47_9BACT|nr:hypothetical protein ElP_63930 [Tautonia plasticadhaerens]
MYPRRPRGINALPRRQSHPTRAAGRSRHTAPPPPSESVAVHRHPRSVRRGGAPAAVGAPTRRTPNLRNHRPAIALQKPKWLRSVSAHRAFAPSWAARVMGQSVTLLPKRRTRGPGEGTGSVRRWCAEPNLATPDERTRCEKPNGFVPRRDAATGRVSVPGSARRGGRRGQSPRMGCRFRAGRGSVRFRTGPAKPLKGFRENRLQNEKWLRSAPTRRRLRRPSPIVEPADRGGIIAPDAGDRRAGMGQARSVPPPGEAGGHGRSGIGREGLGSTIGTGDALRRAGRRGRTAGPSP